MCLGGLRNEGTDHLLFDVKLRTSGRQFDDQAVDDVQAGH